MPHIHTRVPVTLALAMLEGSILPDHVLPASFQRAEVTDLVDRIMLEENPELHAIFLGQRQAVVALNLRNGRQLVSERCDARGNFDAPFSDAELIAKCAAYVEGSLSEQGKDKLTSLPDAHTAPTPTQLIAALTERLP